MRRWSVILLLAVMGMLSESLGYSQQTIDYNARRLKMQKRHVPVDKEAFTAQNWYSNTFAGISFDYVMPAVSTAKAGPGLTLQAGKWFARDHGMRVNILTSFPYNISPCYACLQFGFSADYMFNVSNYVGGYDRNRPCEVSFFTGIGFQTSREMSERRNAFLGQVGVDVNFHLLPWLDFFVQPKFMAMLGNRSATQLSMGLMVRSFDSKNWTPTSVAKGRWYVLCGGGMVWQNSDLVYKMGLGKALGGGFSVGGGCHYLYWLDLQATAFFADDAWNRTMTSKRLDAQYFGGRVEAMVDILSLALRSDSSKWSVGIIAGPEFGIMNKKAVEEAGVRAIYLGATMGVKARCYVWKGLAAYLEPRSTFAPYAAPDYSVSSTTVNRMYYDALLSLNLGVEYHF